MDALNDILDLAADWIFGGVVIPLMKALASLISLCFAPLSGASPALQVCVAALVGALLSMGLTRMRKGKAGTTAAKRFKERLSAKQQAREIDDKTVRSAVYKGLDREADEAYEHLMLDKFFEMGITYLFPMFLFLLWVEYHAFTPDHLEALTGSRGLMLPGISQAIGAGALYLYLYNVTLITTALGRWGVKKVKGNKG
ncbi:hypothetical protein [Desulfoluna spongiiphila]|uniref:Uncharacterized protein n=1 Tax=Desulfoluna spongiiphila TaxID=419481 RepID=A0A1G5JAQ8_9BACT|nr:hypothetical protein [Desulfoluna spongiiphila]SCY85284.1 hypothetical protein SAMN05216233_12710 [Desulfoluna spongiiphila]VVS94192.1 hypothetical protein DBB_37640 [Desulfoluna spongiiphila]